MAKIVILGAGVMGSAMAMPLADNGRDVSLVGTPLDDAIIRSVQGNGYHPSLKLVLPERVSAYTHTQLGELVGDDTELIVLGVSSQGVAWAAEQLAALGRPLPPLLMITKGLSTEVGGLEIFPDTVIRRLAVHGQNDVPVAAVSGPCIAGELAARRHSGVVYTHADAALLRRLQNMLATPYYHIRRNDDVTGVEFCAALKNLYALGIGCAAGLAEDNPADNGAQMYNPAAYLFGQAVLEMKYLIRVYGGRPDSADGHSGAGDLYVTCQGGRNSRMGRLLGKGLCYSVAKAEHMPNDSVEGAQLAVDIGPRIDALCADGTLDAERLPFMRAVIRCVSDDAPIVFDWSAMHRQQDYQPEQSK